ncbi:MAG: DUF4280 domain-containing protein [Sporomusaceae bacterium]|nr:DUF4280 domain-containing protein [Sporomusaceae bacterium]
MKDLVVNGAEITCNQWIKTTPTTPRKLMVPKPHGLFVESKPVAVDTDCKFGANIAPFGPCNVTPTPAGSPSGGPCIPVLAQKWLNPQMDVTVAGDRPLLTNSYLTCTAQAGPGIITITKSGQ